MLNVSFVCFGFFLGGFLVVALILLKQLTTTSTSYYTQGTEYSNSNKHLAPFKHLWSSFLLLLSDSLTVGLSVFAIISPSTLFTSASCSESLDSLVGEKRYWTNEWLESHCQMAAVEKLGWGSSALRRGSCGQEQQCSWYQHARLWRLETRVFLSGKQPSKLANYIFLNFL